MKTINTKENVAERLSSSPEPQGSTLPQWSQRMTQAAYSDRNESEMNYTFTRLMRTMHRELSVMKVKIHGRRGR